MLGRFFRWKSRAAAPTIADAIAHHEAGRLAQAEAIYQRLLENEPQHVDALHFLGMLALQQGDAARAGELIERSLEIHPANVAARFNLGHVRQLQGRLEEAITQYREVLALDAGHAPACYNLGVVCRQLGRRADALAYFKQAVALRPEFAEGLYGLGHLLREEDRLEEAAAAFRRALELRPGYAEARWSLAMCALPRVYSLGEDPQRARQDFSAALASLEQWFAEHLVEDPSATVGVVQPFNLAYQEESNRELLERYGRLCSGLMQQWRERQPPAARPARIRTGALRIGIVSGHFRNHSVWNAIVKGWFQHLDRERFSLYAFALGAAQDGETAYARSRAAHFEQGARDPRQWVEAIERQELDVLIYPEIGMDSVTQKLASLRLAPIQAVAWGHPETSGVPTIDYFLSSEDMEPPQAQAHYSEKLVALPRLGCHIEPRTAVAEAPALERWGIDTALPLLLCPGVPFKYAPQFDWIFPEIATRLGPCRFVFFAYGAEGPWQRLRARLEQTFAARRLDFATHVTFLPWQSSAAFQGWLSRADVFLDTIGFSGFNTAVQAIQRGLPVVTREGRFLRGRLASGPLKRLGLPELVAASEEDYIALAVRLARDGTYSEHIEQAMHEGSHRLFGDLAPVRALEDFLAGVARR
ncbi:MAG TPA: tetratricopeptide repeat protein [Burkholderiales bacterium]